MLTRRPSTYAKCISYMENCALSSWHGNGLYYWTHVRGIKRWAVYSFLKRAIRWTFDSFFAVMWKKLLKIRHQRHNNHHVTSCCWNRRVQLILYFLVIFFFYFWRKKTDKLIDFEQKYECDLTSVFTGNNLRHVGLILTGEEFCLIILD